MLKLCVLMTVLLAVTADPLSRSPADDSSEEDFNVEASDAGTSPSRDDLVKVIYDNVIRQLTSSSEYQRPTNQLSETAPARPALKDRPYHMVPASIYKPMYTSPMLISPFSRYPSFAGPYNPSFYNPYGFSQGYGSYGSSGYPYRPFSSYQPFYMRQKPVYAYPSPMYNPYNKFQATYYHPVTGMPYKRYPVTVLRPDNYQQPYGAPLSIVPQRPFDDNLSDQEAMSYLNSLRVQQQFKPQMIFPSLGQTHSSASRQPDLIDSARSAAQISQMYSQLAQALSAVSGQRAEREDVYYPVDKTEIFA